ncbi:hypothetical protein [Kordia sp.]|uniref:hypothetical protein n=1 Tax=Kordia sp. TaxID=1965332 RepID=UPI003D2B46EE
MDYLNVVFGIIIVISFGHTIYANRELKKVKEFERETIENIKVLAKKIIDINHDSKTESYADSIIQFSSIINKPSNDSFTPLEIGRFKAYYYPFDESAMRTRCGIIHRDPKAKLRMNLTAMKLDTQGRAVYGPYKRLPFKSKYLLRYSIRLNENEYSKFPDLSTEVLTIDIFDYVDTNTLLNIRKIKLEELTLEYKEFRLEFEYQDLRQTLEYRLNIEVKGISVSIDYISVENIR